MRVFIESTVSSSELAVSVIEYVVVVHHAVQTNLAHAIGNGAQEQLA